MNLKSELSFVKNDPCGEYLFEGKSHDRIAEGICNVIKKVGDCFIIGIDGGWGSGKSNVVKLIEKKLGINEYHFFIYDAWGHQEDLQRRAFLEELTEDLTLKEVIPRNWLIKLKELLSKTKETKSKTVPTLSYGVIFIALALLVSPILNLFPAYFPRLRYKLLVTSIPLLLLSGVYVFYYFKIKGTNVFDKLKEAFIKLFLEYQNKGEESIKYELISEDEPSVRNFRKWMKEISDDLGSKKLILVFDNMDRLPAKKVQELWSSIHVFFAENNYPNIKVLIPFDREHIKSAFKSEDNNGKNYGDDFINKTFNVVYRVSPPILSDWKKYFISQWFSLFKKDLSSDESLSSVLHIFDNLREGITPRKVIAFINEFITVKQLFSETIPNKYIALYILGKDKIINDPVKEIISPSYLKGLNVTFGNDENLPKYIAALHYQVEADKAIEIIFTNKLQKALQEKDLNTLQIISEIQEFSLILENAINEVNNIENTVLSLNNLAEKQFSNLHQYNEVWDTLSKRIPQRHDCKIADFQLIMLQKTSFKSEYLKQTIADLQNDGNFIAYDYYNSIKKITQLDQTLNVISILPEKKTTPEDFVKFLKNTDKEFIKYKITCDETLLDTFLAKIELDRYDELEYLHQISGSFTLKTFMANIEEYIDNNSASNSVSVLGPLYSCYRAVSNKFPLDKVLQDRQIYNLFTNSSIDDQYYPDWISMRISKFDQFNTTLAPVFEEIMLKPDANLSKRVATVIESYVNFDTLLLSLKTFSRYPLYVSIIKELIETCSEKSQANIVEILKEYPTIIDLAELNIDETLECLNGWHSNAEEDITPTNLKQIIPVLFIEHSNNKDLEICKHILKVSKQYLDNLVVEEWELHLSNVNNYEFRLVLLLTDYYIPQAAFDSFKNVMKKISEGDITPSGKVKWQNLIDRLLSQNHTMKSTFNSVRDTFVREDNVTPELFNFFAEWLFEYADLTDKKESLRILFNSSVIRDTECLSLIIKNQTKMPSIMIAAGEEVSDFKAAIAEKVAENNDNQSLVDFAEFIGLQIKKSNKKK